MFSYWENTQVEYLSNSETANKKFEITSHQHLLQNPEDAQDSRTSMQEGSRFSNSLLLLQLSTAFRGLPALKYVNKRPVLHPIPLARAPEKARGRSTSRGGSRPRRWSGRDAPALRAPRALCPCGLCGPAPCGPSCGTRAAAGQGEDTAKRLRPRLPWLRRSSGGASRPRPVRGQRHVGRQREPRGPGQRERSVPASPEGMAPRNPRPVGIRPAPGAGGDGQYLLAAPPRCPRPPRAAPAGPAAAAAPAPGGPAGAASGGAAAPEPCGRRRLQPRPSRPAKGGAGAVRPRCPLPPQGRDRPEAGAPPAAPAAVRERPCGAEGPVWDVTARPRCLFCGAVRLERRRKTSERNSSAKACPWIVIPSERERWLPSKGVKWFQTKRGQLVTLADLSRGSDPAEWETVRVVLLTHPVPRPRERPSQVTRVPASSSG